VTIFGSAITAPTIMSSPSTVVDTPEERLNRIAKLNDLGIEHWMKNDLDKAEQFFARALRCLRSLGHDDKVAAHIPERRDDRTTLRTTIKIGKQEHPAGIYDRVFLLTNKSIKWSLGSVKIVAAAVFYHVALFHHLRIQRGGGDSQLQSDGYRFVVRFYEKANHLLGRYMETTRSPLWLFQAALWHNVGLCYKQKSISDPCAVYVYFEQMKSIVNWIETQDRSFFKSAIMVAELQQPMSAGARVVG
jgi:hypothetical protein